MPNKLEMRRRICNNLSNNCCNIQIFYGDDTAIGTSQAPESESVLSIRKSKDSVGQDISRFDLLALPDLKNQVWFTALSDRWITAWSTTHHTSTHNSASERTIERHKKMKYLNTDSHSFSVKNQEVEVLSAISSSYIEDTRQIPQEKEQVCSKHWKE